MLSSQQYPIIANDVLVDLGRWRCERATRPGIAALSGRVKAPVSTVASTGSLSETGRAFGRRTNTCVWRRRLINRRITRREMSVRSPVSADRCGAKIAAIRPLANDWPSAREIVKTEDFQSGSTGFES